MYKLISLKSEEKRLWYYFCESEGAARLTLRLCEGCETRASALGYIQQARRDECLVRSITAGMYEPFSESYEKRRQFGKSVYGATLAQKKSFLQKINEDFGGVPIQEISEKDVESRLFKAKRSGSWKNAYLETFLDVYREARWKGIKVALPAFERFKRDSKKADVLSQAEVKALFAPKNFSSPAMLLMFELGLCCGLRLGEMRAVRARQILADKGALVVDGYINKMGERTNYNKKGTEEKPKFRAAFLPQKLLEKLIAFSAGRNLGADDYLFGANGKPFSQSFAYKSFVRAAKKAGLAGKGRKIVPHSLRYTYITRMRGLLSGETVKKLAGHSSVEMTDYYTRAALADLLDELAPTQASAERCFGDL